MSNNDAPHDNGHEGIHVIGFFPTRFDPSVPDLILISANNEVRLLNRNRCNKPCTEKDRRMAIKASLRLKANQWVIVDKGELKPIKLNELGSWRDDTAAALVQQAMEIKGDPLVVLKLLESAANLRSLNLASLASTLSAQRANADERLEDVFRRVRENGEGQTNP